ncbi:isoaspartyl peptidase/L-asparaginase, partial [Capnocytophaga canis]|uniref:isoaspartyl peptidase/L-asparaginase n=1 Tax=Capnocytophaga canis TaxID=1848903 RepID=UPI0005A5F3BB
MKKAYFVSLCVLLSACNQTVTKNTEEKTIVKPVVISTWNHGLPANDAAWKILVSGGSALDAVEKGVMTAEADPEETSVGYGGYPDREGNVTLDACIM